MPIRPNAALSTGLWCVALLAACQVPDRRSSEASLEELRITVSESREVAYTNKEAGFYYSLTHGNQTSGWHGWHVMSKKVLDDYAVAVDGGLLSRDDVVRAEVFPHRFTRIYRDGTRETVTVLDSVDALVVELAGLSGDTLCVWPLYSDAGSRDEFLIEAHSGSIALARKASLHRAVQTEPPRWIGMRLLNAGSPGQVLTSTPDRPGRFAPAGLAVPIRGESVTVVLVAADSAEACSSLLDQLAIDLSERLTRRAARMEALLRQTQLWTDNKRLTKALHWALLSLDALMMRQGRPGIFAGLPWFSNYWGRDTFIALPGAALATGRYEEAREILLSFAEWQQSDPESDSYGRIPNLVTPQAIAYNTADGTPWFVIALERYYRSSADTAFINTLLPVVRRSIEGAIEHHTDREGFLTHGDAETWMDAVGPDGPWSPRGNRANDLQWLWYRQLLAGADLTDDSVCARAWRGRAERLRSRFVTRFLDTATGLVIDHLNRDGTPDRQVRPNQFFVLTSPDFFPDEHDAFRTATAALVYPHGVASLSQEDENFHPYHHYPPYYVQDAAYHNGIVWTWLAGPWIDAAVQRGYQEVAFSLTANMVHQVLDRGAVGTMSELLDACPREGESEPRVSGTFSQAWSLAEFLRVFYDDYLGISIDAPRSSLRLHPRLPSSLHRTSAAIRLGSWVIPLEIRSTGSTTTLSLAAPRAAPPITLDCSVESSPGNRWHFTEILRPGSTSEFVADADGVICRSGGVEGIAERAVTAKREIVHERTPMLLATPRLQPQLRALSGPRHPLLPHAAVKSSNPEASVLFEGADPPFDDHGPGTFLYPTSRQLKPGSLDLTHVSVTSDSSMAYFNLGFRSLSNPGWHPEYGFQLTYVAIAIDTDRRVSSREQHLGWNSNVVLGKDFGYERLVLIGGGIRILDARGTVLAEHIPAPGDESNPLGNALEGTISFALPRELLALPSAGARVAIFVGAQDDHGGAGLGEFRTVSEEPGEWTGGGRRRPSDPNVYDTLILEQKPSSTPIIHH